MSYVRSIRRRVDQRTGFETAIKGFLDENIPDSSGWHQAFGSVAFFLILVQALTGMLLALNFTPAPGEAYHSLQHIIHNVTAGRLIRGLHHWGSSMLIIAVGLHMIQVAIYGAYKKPREATWILGVILLLLVLGFGLTGYLLPWDNKAYWSTVVTTHIAGSAPGLGSLLTRFLGVENGAIGTVAFARFYGLHTMLLPAATLLSLGLHIYLVRRHGVTPAAGDTAPKQKFYPEQVFKDTVAISIAFAILFFMAAAIDAPLSRLADPTDVNYVPRPEWYFLFLFQSLKFFEGSWEFVGSIVLPTVAILLLVMLPFLDRGRAKRLQERTGAIALTTLSLTGWAALTVAALVTTPEQRQPPAATLADSSGWTELSAEELAGLFYFRQNGCIACHNVMTGDPKAGPTLATLAVKPSVASLTEHAQSRLAAASPGAGATRTTELNQTEILAIAAMVGRLSPQTGYGIEQAPEFALHGARLFSENNCGTCHRIHGEALVGPPLGGIGVRQGKNWVKEKIQNPSQFAAETVMPPTDLPPEDLDDLASYLVALPGH